MGRTARDTDDGDLQGFPMTLGDDLHDDLINGDPSRQQQHADDDDDEEGALEEAIQGIQSQLDDLKAGNGNNNEFLQNMLMQLTAAQQQNNQGQGQGQGNQRPGLDLNDLPDPVNDREGFNSTLNERLNGWMQDAEQQLSSRLQQQSSTVNSLSDLENRFLRNHAELSEKTALFEVSVRQEVQNLQGRGMTKEQAQQYVFSNPDKFLGDVATRMKNELGLSEGGDEFEDDDDMEDLGGGRKVQRTLTAKRRPSRAKSVRSGSAPGSKLRKRRGGNESSKGFVDQLKQAQLDSGLF